MDPVLKIAREDICTQRDFILDHLILWTTLLSGPLRLVDHFTEGLFSEQIIIMWAYSIHFVVKYARNEALFLCPPF